MWTGRREPVGSHGSDRSTAELKGCLLKLLAPASLEVVSMNTGGCGKTMAAEMHAPSPSRSNGDRSMKESHNRCKSSFWVLLRKYGRRIQAAGVWLGSN